MSAEKIRRARESKIEAGGHSFTIRRPTDLDMAEGPSGIDLIKRHVVDWDLKEMDVFPGGNPEPAAFEAETWAEWIADRPDLWRPLSKAINDAYVAHAKALGDAAKN